jgi:DNA-directed RNA polymerase subunit N (RpoN/RPB10)
LAHANKQYIRTAYKIHFNLFDLSFQGLLFCWVTSLAIDFNIVLLKVSWSAGKHKAIEYLLLEELSKLDEEVRINLSHDRYCKRNIIITRFILIDAILTFVPLIMIDLKLPNTSLLA